MQPDDTGPRPTPVDRSRFDEATRTDLAEGVEGQAPERAEQDWDALEGAPILPDSVPGEEDDVFDAEPDGELPEEDDDNPDQDSDQALPDDEEERAIRRDWLARGSAMSLSDAASAVCAGACEPMR